MKKLGINMPSIQEDLRKLGVILIAGGIIGLTFEKNIDEVTAYVSFFFGLVLILTGSLKSIASNGQEINND